MKGGRRSGLIALAVLCAIGVICATFLIAASKARSETHAVGDRQLQIIALDLGSVLAKYETLPFALSYHPEAAQVIANPADAAAIHHLNLTLQAIQRQAKVAAIYLMDSTGLTLAATNWDQPETQNFVGKRFGFRPYFLDAIQGRAGRFYGIGNTTNEPGYFIAQPVYPPGASRATATPIGVIAVKISLDEFEQTWRSSEEPIVLADQGGVIFLSNRAEWKYHSLHALSSAELQHVTGTQQYAGLTISPILSLPVSARIGFGDQVSRPIGPLGWQLMLFPSERRITRTAVLSAAAAALLTVVAALTFWAMHQRRRRMEERRESRDALQRAAEDLDLIIAQRTQELLSANQNLETKYVTLKDTEHLLRSTQNELVQAGKLAMLGQMAAGVTHELNQPLAAIRAFADNAGTFLSRGQTDKAVENLSHISDASARMGAIISQLKGFARKSHDTVATVDLTRSIHASAFLLQSEYRRLGVSLDLDVPESLEIIGDAVRTEQVLINLLRNALDAVESSTEKRVIVTLGIDGGEAMIRIRDTGAGILEQVAKHLFEPFFTTKPPGKGLGLGLAISSSIIQAMNGQLTARNHPDGGAEFVVRLPRLDLNA